MGEPSTAATCSSTTCSSTNRHAEPPADADARSEPVRYAAADPPSRRPARYDTIAAGPEHVAARVRELRSEKTEIAIADALCDNDLRTLGAGCSRPALLTGGSGWGSDFRRITADRTCCITPVPRRGFLKFVAVRSSLPAAARSQPTPKWPPGATPTLPSRRSHGPGRGEPAVERAIDWAVPMLGREPMLIYSTSPADEVKAVQSTLGVDQAGVLVERAMAEIARKLHQRGALFRGRWR